MAPSPSGRFLRWAAATRNRHRLAAGILKSGAPLLPRSHPPRAPIFILGSPRSGTTLLFDVLDRSTALASLQTESHVLWDMFHRIEDTGFASHAIGPDEITARERRVLWWAIDQLSGGRRYLDKFPRNCLRVEYLVALFPDARFVHIVRDGRAAVSSLITGWRATGRFGRGTKLPEPLRIEGYAGTTWRFLVPPGWREYSTGHTLAEVCAFQWTAANEAVLAARPSIAKERWTELRYEGLVEEPRQTASTLLERLGLPRDEEVLSFAEGLDRHVTRMTVSAPSPEKWRRENGAEVDSILPEITPMMERLGYSLS